MHGNKPVKACLLLAINYTKFKKKATHLNIGYEKPKITIKLGWQRNDITVLTTKMGWQRNKV